MNGESYQRLAALLDRVRRRWRAIAWLNASARGASGAALVLICALLAPWVAPPEGLPFVLLWGVAVAAVVAVVVWLIVTRRGTPRDVQLARFIEERCPQLEDSLATAVAQLDGGESPVAAAVARDAARRVDQLDIDAIIGRPALRRAALAATGAVVVLALAAAFSARPMTQAARMAGMYLFPERLGLNVTPGDVKVRAGESLRIAAVVTGGVIVPVVRVESGAGWRETRMQPAPGGFAHTIDRVERDFRYAVQAAGASSREYTVTVVHPPRVERIDLHYEYPAAFGMAPREEADAGDIYGPAGTRVRVTVRADKPIQHAALNLTGGTPIALTAAGEGATGELTILEDGSYRIALADLDGLASPGDTEYFIRTLQDRPPDVRIIRPASDRQVTPVEEVSIDAGADDDFGVASLDLVFAVRGGPEKAVPFERKGSRTAVTGSRMLYLEDLGVRPGDFVSYYARARDISRGKRSSETRSDIFFLEVTPFEEEFVVSQSQGSGAGSGDEQSLEELSKAQKDVITATWNLDRRSREAKGQSQDDIRAVAHAQSDLRGRAAAMRSELQRAGDMRRRRAPGARGAAAGGADPMLEAVTRAVEAMGRASRQLEDLKTTDALPHEMTALNELLRAQAEVRRREIQQQANGTSGRGSNRQQEDLSSLFDRELTKQQQTNYEAPSGGESKQQNGKSDEVANQIRELARRQDELSRRQGELAKRRDRSTEEEQRRELERLTREQMELRRDAEELARNLQQERQQGRQQASRDVQQASEDMQGAASELRRDNPQQASTRGSRAAERLRDIEQRMRGTQPGDRQRAAGELQLESQQLADAQRRLSKEGASGRGAGDRTDQARRRAFGQERLAERAERLEQGVRQLAAASQRAEPNTRSALNDAAQEVDRSRTSQRMRDAARAERQDAGTQAGQPSPEVRQGEEIARGLERVASRLGKAGGQDDASQQLGEELSRLRQLREELAGLDRRLADLRAEGGTGEHSAQQSWGDVRELLNEVRRGDPKMAPDVEGFNPGRSAPGTEPWKQDFARWDQLKVQLAAALERAEQRTADRLRDQQSRDRLAAGGTQAVPEQYRKLVERYYRALAAEEKK